MKKYSDLEYLRLSKWDRFVYTLVCFFYSIPTGILNFFKKIVSTVVGIFKMFAAEISDIAETFKNGDWKTRTSFFVMGFGNIARGQVLRGILFLAFEIIFIVYMVCGGAH